MRGKVVSWKWEDTLTKIDWSLVCGPLDTCESMWTSFHEFVHSGLNIIMPEKQIPIHPTDAPRYQIHQLPWR